MTPRLPGGSRTVAQPRTIAIAAGAITTLVAAFLFRFLSVDFTNDHFMHLAEGRQVLRGEWPLRDFFDFGLPAQVLTSAATLAWSGHNLYGEALITCAFIAAGAALTFLVSARLSHSIGIAAVAALLTTLSAPRLYNYPKAFWYVCALWAAWRYASRPEARHAILLGAIVAAAFLYRHDHGIYIAFSTIPLFAIVHWGQWRVGAAAVLRFAMTGILVIAPFLVFVQLTLGLPWYLSEMGPGAATSTAPRFNALPITVDPGAPLVTFTPVTPYRVTVRWTPAVDAPRRTALEQKYRLEQPAATAERTWSYAVGDERDATIRALTNDAAVEDTGGIDRAAGRLDVRELWYEWLARRIPLFRMHLLPGVFAPANALPVYYYVTFAVPLLALVTLLTAAWRGAIPRAEAASVAMAVLMSMVIVETLVRGSPDSRLPDVTAAVSVTGAWMAARWLRQETGARRWPRRLAATVATAMLIWAVGSQASAWAALDATRILTGPSGIAWRFDQLRQRLQRPPIESWGRDESGYAGLTRYAYECTASDDRLLVTWFEPMIYFYADRAFAGAHPFFDGGWQDSTRDQQFSLERLRRQPVPLVFIRNDFELMFRKYFPLIAAHVDAHYRHVDPQAHADRIAGYQVWVDSSRTPVRTYEPLGLPCYR